MKISQIKVLYSEEKVNKWLKLNPHLEVVNISITKYDFGRTDFLVHFKAEAKIDDEDE